jgi:hypothetical protein
VPGSDMIVPNPLSQDAEHGTGRLTRTCLDTSAGNDIYFALDPNRPIGRS